MFPGAEFTLNPEQWRYACRYAEALEHEAAACPPDERSDMLLEAAEQWTLADECERALRIYDDLAETAPEENAQWAAAGKAEVLTRLGRHEEADAEIARLRRSHVHEGPAAVIAEFLENHGRLEEALTWFNIACRDVLADEDEAIIEGTLLDRIELQGRARVRAALGLAPDALDELAAEELSEPDEPLPQGPPPSNVGSFFVRSDVKHAFAEGLVHVDDPEDDDVDSYFRRVEKGWRASAEHIDAAVLRILPMTVEDLLKYGAEHGCDPKDQQTRADHLLDRIREGAPALSWPPERNDPCWCGSGRKYKKCCGSPSNR
jgi:tetratricopeptide (TPR) repeat protein